MNQLLIIGGGLAGASLAAEAYERGISFKWVISETIPTASFAAYGMCNPVHFHNIVPAWKAEEFLEPARKFYIYWQTKTGSNFYNPLEVHHLVVDRTEIIQWRQQVESTDLWKYTTGDLDPGLNTILQPTVLGAIPITASFFVDIQKFVFSIREFLKEHIIVDDFNHSDLQLHETGLSWKKYQYQKIVFAEGSAGRSNPYFAQVPFNLCKGETLVLKIHGLKLDVAIHKKIALVPLHDQRFICGSTYEWDDLSFQPSKKGKDELLGALHEILGDDFKSEVIEHKVGVRPTISDRRPVVGWHPSYPQVGILNGFGTKGLMFGPTCVSNLLNNLQTQQPILKDWDVVRFKKRLSKKP